MLYRVNRSYTDTPRTLCLTTARAVQQDYTTATRVGNEEKQHLPGLQVSSVTGFLLETWTLPSIWWVWSLTGNTISRLQESSMRTHACNPSPCNYFIIHWLGSQFPVCTGKTKCQHILIWIVLSHSSTPSSCWTNSCLEFRMAFALQWAAHQWLG